MGQVVRPTFADQTMEESGAVRIKRKCNVEIRDRFLALPFSSHPNFVKKQKTDGGNKDTPPKR